jgi:carbonic anhydrase
MAPLFQVQNLEKRHVTRRTALRMVAGVVLPMGIAETPLHAEEPTSRGVSGLFYTALARLKEGNARFVQDELQHHHSSREWRSQLKAAQQPFATLLCCSDSRVPPELVFDQGFGDLFIVRIAGNIIAADVLGSIQYASHHLHTPLFVVLGHEGCGAVTAAVDALLGQHHEPAYIARLVEMITPGLKELDRNLPRKQLLDAAVEANVRWSMQQLLAMPEAQRALQAKRAALVGAVYSLETGKVRFLEDPERP